MNASVRPSGEKRGCRSCAHRCVSWRARRRPVGRDEPQGAGDSHRSPGATVWSVTTASRPSGDRRGSVGDPEPDTGRRGGADAAREPPGSRDDRSLAGYHRPTMADQLSLRLEADRLPDLPDLRPMLAAPAAGAVRLGRAPVRAVVGRRRGRSCRSARPTRPGAARSDRDADGRDLTAALPELAGTGRPGRRTVGDPRRGAGRRRRRTAGPIPRSWSGDSPARPAGRPRSSPSTCSISTGGRCCRSRSSDDARRCGGSSGRATRSSRCRRSRRRASRCSMRSWPRASPGCWPASGRAPTCPGVRSRLWRFIPAASRRVPSSRRSRGPPAAPTAATAPVLALISRLPLDDEA